MARRENLHVIVYCPSTKPSEGIVVAKAGGIGGVASVLGEGGIEAKEGHGGQDPRVVLSMVGLRVELGKIKDEWLA